MPTLERSITQRKSTLNSVKFNSPGLLSKKIVYTPSVLAHCLIALNFSVFENLIDSGKTSRYLFLPFMLMNLNAIF